MPSAASGTAANALSLAALAAPHEAVVGHRFSHIATDETDTAREAVLEGQAMVSFADYMLADNGHPGKTLKDMPQVLDGSSALRGKIFTADQKSLFATSG